VGSQGRLLVLERQDARSSIRIAHPAPTASTHAARERRAGCWGCSRLSGSSLLSTRLRGGSVVLGEHGLRAAARRLWPRFLLRHPLLLAGSVALLPDVVDGVAACSGSELLRGRRQQSFAERPWVEEREKAPAAPALDRARDRDVATAVHDHLDAAHRRTDLALSSAELEVDARRAATSQRKPPSLGSCLVNDEQPGIDGRAVGVPAVNEVVLVINGDGPIEGAHRTRDVRWGPIGWRLSESLYARRNESNVDDHRYESPVDGLEDSVAGGASVSAIRRDPEGNVRKRAERLCVELTRAEVDLADLDEFREVRYSARTQYVLTYIQSDAGNRAAVRRLGNRPTVENLEEVYLRSRGSLG